MTELPTVFDEWHWGVDHYPPEDRAFLVCCGTNAYDVLIGYMNGSEIEAVGLAYSGIVIFDGRQIWWRDLPTMPHYKPDSEVERLYGTDYPKAGKPMSQASDSELRNYFGSAYSYRPTNALESPWGNGESLVTQTTDTKKLGDYRPPSSIDDDKTKLLKTTWNTRDFIKMVKRWRSR